MALLAAIIIIPLPYTQNINVNGATGTFTTSDRFVFFNGECVIAQWQVDNIQAIRFDGLDTVGSGSGAVCVDADAISALSLTFTNGESADYPLNVIILGRNSLTWVLIVAALLAVIVGAGLWLTSNIASDMPIGLRLLRGLETTIIITLITVAVLEIGFRAWVVVAGSVQEKLIYTGTTAEIQAASQRFVSMPFVTYGLPPQIEDVNEFGYRGEEFTIPKPPETYRILTLGGSTTYGYKLESDETWAHYLEQTLQTTYDYPRVEVINGGIESYQTWNSLTNLAFRGTEVEPDLVIVYHGINDALAATNTTPDCYAGYNLNRGLGSTRNWFFDTPQLGPSAFWRYVSIRLGWTPNPMTDTAIPISTGSFNACDAELPLGITQDERITMNDNHYFERNLRSMVYLAQGHGYDIMLTTFAANSILNPQIPVEYEPPRTVVYQQNEIVRNIADKLDILFYDLEREWVFDPLHWQDDDIHQTAAGNLAQAEQFAAYLDEKGVIPR